MLSLTAAALFVATQAATGQPLERPAVEAWLDGYFARAMPEAGLAGAVVVVVKDGQVLVAKGYGVADVVSGRRVDPARTLFRVGSISKLFTATAVMRLVEQGKLDLDRDINDYLDFDIPSFDASPLTLRRLLTHETGFEDVLKGLVMHDPADAGALRDYVVRRMPRRVASAGIVPAYSNYGFALAGYIVERMVGAPFAEAVRGLVLEPLRMTHSTFAQPVPAPLHADLASGYRDPADPPRPFSIYGPAPAGALSATGLDMARFMIAHLQDGELDDRRILEAASARTMRARAGSGPTALPGIGLGFWRFERNGHLMVGHDGGDPEFRSNLRLLPDDHVGLFVSFNALGPSGGVFPVRAGLIDGFLDRFFPGPVLTEGVPPAASGHARLAEGVYETSDRKGSFFGVLSLIDQARVSGDDSGAVTVSTFLDSHGRPKRWLEVGDWIWREEGGHDLLAMTVADGRVVGIRRGSDAAGALLRVPAWHAWLLPLFMAAVVVLATSALLWLAGLLRAIRVRSTSHRRLYHATHVVALIDVGFVLGWIWIFSRLGGGDAALFSDKFDPVLRALQALGLVGAAGATLAVVNAVVVWRGRAGWRAMGTAALVALAAVTFSVVAAVSGLLNQSLRY